MRSTFDFDENGVKKYDIGGNTVEISLDDDLNIKIFDVNAAKYVKSFPRKSTDTDKQKVCSEDFKVFKKKLNDFIKSRAVSMNKMYLTGAKISNELWFNAYVKHNVLSKISKLLVWCDENNTKFVVTQDGVIDVNSKSYKPVGQIGLAHIFDMTDEEIENWRNFLASQKTKQLFAQIWEPVVIKNADFSSLKNRYKDVVITKKERTNFRTVMKGKGVKVSSKIYGEFDYRSWEYNFSDSGTICIRNDIYIDYAVDEKTSDATLGKMTINDNANKKIANTAIFELDKIVMKNRIANDKAEFVTKEHLDAFSVEQINEFINLSTENKSVNCTAALLEYKNKTYPDYDWLDSLVLDF